MGTTAQKLEYLGTTKSQLKDMINYGLDENKITSSTTFRNYVSSIKEAFLEALRTPDTLFTNLPKKSASGSNISLTGVANAPMRITLQPTELTQASTPTPSSPQEVHTISGSNKVVVCGKNLNKMEQLKLLVNSSGVVASDNFTWNALIDTTNINSLIVKGDYTLLGDGALRLGLFNEYPKLNSQGVRQTFGASSSGIIDTTNYKYVLLCYLPANGHTAQEIENSFMVNIGSTPLTYEPYISQEAEIDLSSYNLLDFESMQFQEANSAVVKINKDNKEITITNTTNQYGCIRIYQSGLDLKPSTSYVFSAKVKKSDTSTGCNAYASAGITGLSSITGSTVSVGNTCYVSFTTGATIDNNGYVALYPNGTNKYAVFSEIQIVEGSTLKSYKEYVKTPINYSKISTYEDKFIRTSGKNLMPVSTTASTTTNQVKFTNNGDGSYTFDGTASSYTTFTLLTGQKFSGTHTYYLKETETAGFTMFLQRSGGIGVAGTTTYRAIDDEVNIILIGISGGTQLNNLTIRPYIYSGDYDSNMSYEPYGSNEWYIKKNIGKVVLDGTENWQLYSASGSSPRRFGLQDNTTWYADSMQLVSNYFTRGVKDSQNDLEMWTQVHYLAITDKNSNWADATALKTWFNSHNTTVYYVLATPTYTQITGTLEEQLENVYQKLLSYSGTTNISQVNNDLPFVLSVQAIEE